MEKWLVVKSLLVRLKQVPEGWRWAVVRWWRCCAIWRSLSSCVCCVCVVLCLVSLFGISFPFFAGEIDTSYPSRPCSSATRSLKLFLFSFPAGINSPIFSAPQNFTPILLQHSHCLPGRFGCLSAFPTWLWPLWAGDLYLTHFRFSLADAAHSPSYFLKGAECLTS